MRGFIDLHCHWVAGIDDGARTAEEATLHLQALYAAGFDRVVATPHMRPGLFDNDREALEAAFAATMSAVSSAPGLPEVLGVSSEHFLDDVVFARLMAGTGLPYPGGRAALVELPPRRFPNQLKGCVFELRRRRLRPVIAHPERYEPVWEGTAELEPLLDGGAILQLDVAALVGKYGRSARRAAERLLEEGAYYAAASDSHRPSDLDDVSAGIERLIELVGDEEARFLLQEGPQAILDGTVET